MSRARTAGIVALLGLLSLPPIGLGGLYVWVANPQTLDLPLPEGQVPLDSAPGQAALARAIGDEADDLLASMQIQEKRSWCGVASGAAALGAMGRPLTQDGWFSGDAGQVRSWWRVTFGGMTLAEFGAMAAAHGVAARVTHAGDSTEGAFRDALRTHLRGDDVVVVANYHRGHVGQEGGGHLSPLAAYDAETDRVLVLDTAGYKYPPHWLPLPDLFAAMDTTDSSSERTRGWAVLSPRP